MHGYRPQLANTLPTPRIQLGFNEPTEFNQLCSMVHHEDTMLSSYIGDQSSLQEMNDKSDPS